MSDSDKGVSRLTPRQRDILRLVAKHWQQKEIARELKISPDTVKDHLTAVRRHLAVATTREAVMIFSNYELGHDTPSEGGGLPEGLGETPQGVTRLGYEQDIYTEQRPRHDQLPRLGDRIADAIQPGQTSHGEGHGADNSNLESDGPTGEGGVQSDISGGVADIERNRDRPSRTVNGWRNRVIAVEDWLNAQGLIRRLTTLGAIAVGLTFIVGGILVGVIGTLESLERFFQP